MTSSSTREVHHARVVGVRVGGSGELNQCANALPELNEVTHRPSQVLAESGADAAASMSASAAM